MIKKIIIIGARGFGREIHDFIKNLNSFNYRYNVLGFLDDKADALDGFCGYAPIISSVEEYVPKKDEYFFCALGDAFAREMYTNIIKNKGGQLVSLIHPTSIINGNAVIGEGVLISAYSLVSSYVKIGDNTIIHPFCDLGHDTEIADNCTIESYSFFGGFSKVGHHTTIHTRSTILPHIVIGDNVSVGAGSVVIRNVKSGTSIFGVPAKKIEF